MTDLTSKKVLTITMNPSLDIGTEAEEVITDQKTRCKQPVYDPGGGGINVARVLHRLGVQSEALFISGGYTGSLLNNMMSDENINCLQIDSKDLTRQNISIIDNSSGQQYRFVLPGKISDESVWKSALDKIRSVISGYEYIVGSGSLPQGAPVDFYSRVAQLCGEADKRFILDTSGESLFQGLNNGAEFIKPNQEEFNEMKRIFGADSDEALCDTLFKKGVKHIVHTLGKEKTILITPESRAEFTPPKVNVRSTIGAGDSFVGGVSVLCVVMFVHSIIIASRL